MAEGTLIEWARHPVTGLGATWNIVTGCSVVSPGCTNCYAMKLAGTRLKHHPSRQGLTVDTKAGPVWTGETRFNEQWLTQPLGWKKPHGIFVAAHGDLFAEGVADDQLDRIFAVMALTPQHIYYVLTKRPERMRAYLSTQLRNHKIAAGSCLIDTDTPMVRFPGLPLPNVWLGVSVEDQARADQRIPVLLDTPAAIRFISAEPLLGPIDLTNLDDGLKDGVRLCFDALTGLAHDGHDTISGIFGQPDPKLDWVIAGGESGPSARPTHPDWIRQLRDHCKATGTAFFFKQWGAAIPVYGANGADLTAEVYDGPILDGVGFAFVGKKAAGRVLDMVEHTAWPEIRT